MINGNVALDFCLPTACSLKPWLIGCFVSNARKQCKNKLHSIPKKQLHRFLAQLHEFRFICQYFFLLFFFFFIIHITAINNDTLHFAQWLCYFCSQLVFFLLLFECSLMCFYFFKSFWQDVHCVCRVHFKTGERKKEQRCKIATKEEKITIFC